MIAKVRELDIACSSIHGGGRRPEPPLDLTALAPAVRRVEREEPCRPSRLRGAAERLHPRDLEGRLLMFTRLTLAAKLTALTAAVLTAWWLIAAAWWAR